MQIKGTEGTYLLLSRYLQISRSLEVDILLTTRGSMMSESGHGLWVTVLYMVHQFSYLLFTFSSWSHMLWYMSQGLCISFPMILRALSYKFKHGKF